MPLSKKIRIPNELYKKIERVVEHTDYAAPSEFVLEIIEKEVDQRLNELSIKKQLKGLGYIE